MNNEEILELAVSAGLVPWTKHEYIGGKNFSASDDGIDGDAAALIQFAELVAKNEREACAKIVESEAMQYAEPVWAFEIVNDIKARGQA